MHANRFIKESSQIRGESSFPLLCPRTIPLAKFPILLTVNYNFILNDSLKRSIEDRGTVLRYFDTYTNSHEEDPVEFMNSHELYGSAVLYQVGSGNYLLPEPLFICEDVYIMFWLLFCVLPRRCNLGNWRGCGFFERRSSRVANIPRRYSGLQYPRSW